MENGMILGIVIVIVFLAVRSVVKKAKSKASCCGSGAYVAKSKKLKAVTEKRVYQVEGIRCQNCVNRIMENLQSIPHVSAAVDVKRGRVTVSMAQHVEPELLRQAIEKGGYQITGENAF